MCNKLIIWSLVAEHKLEILQTIYGYWFGH